MTTLSILRRLYTNKKNTSKEVFFVTLLKSRAEVWRISSRTFVNNGAGIYSRAMS
jgi:hypothetical protein